MPGLVFTEFVERVEDKFSPETADAVLDAVDTPHGGAHTAGGYYPHEESATPRMTGRRTRGRGVHPRQAGPLNAPYARGAVTGCVMAGSRRSVACDGTRAGACRPGRLAAPSPRPGG